jgi:UDP-glucose 4-epimerase
VRNVTVISPYLDSERLHSLGKGKGMSVLNMIEAMRKATKFDYKYKCVRMSERLLVR